MRFNPPPNWPPVPPGWVPDAGWGPDPAWPPPPPGWQLWVDDGAVPPPLDYPQGMPWPMPPVPPKSRKPLWIALAAVAVVIVLVGAVTLFVGGRGGGDSHSRKSDITNLTSEMLLERSAFPDAAEGKTKWISGVNNTASRDQEIPGLKIDPPECANIFGTKDATQTGAATLSRRQADGVGSLRVQLVLGREHRDLKSYLHKCESFTQTVEVAGHSLTTEQQLKALDVAGLPSWAIAALMTSSTKGRIILPMTLTSTTIAGYYRGVLVMAINRAVQPGVDNDHVDTATTEELVKLFNDQIEKLEAAP